MERLRASRKSQNKAQSIRRLFLRLSTKSLRVDRNRTSHPQTPSHLSRSAVLSRCAPRLEFDGVSGLASLVETRICTKTYVHMMKAGTDASPVHHVTGGTLPRPSPTSSQWKQEPGAGHWMAPHPHCPFSLAISDGSSSTAHDEVTHFETAQTPREPPEHQVGPLFTI